MNAVTAVDGGTVKWFQCDECSFSADNWEAWDRHVQEHHQLLAVVIISHISITTTTAILRPFVWDYPGESVPEG